MPENISQWTYDWAKPQEDLLPFRFETIASTNTHAKTLSSVKNKNQLVIADEQSSGRGRGANTWTSPTKGSSLLTSWIFDLNFTPQPILPALVGLSVFEALLEIGGFTEVAMKVPNDIYMGKKKVGGILIENLIQGDQNRLIIGIGLNVFNIPNVDIAECIQDFRKERIDECAWNGFLIELYKRLKSSIEESRKNTLSDEKRQSILDALNKFELLKKKYLEVLPSGEIKTPKGIIPWTQI